MALSTRTTRTGTTSTRRTRRDVAHLARRAGFGLHADDVDALAAGGYEAAVDRVIGSLGQADAAAAAVAPPAFDPTASRAARQSDDPAVRRQAFARQRREHQMLVAWWVRRMVAADHPAREKLTLLWHDHFATSLQKVKVSTLMQRQYQTLYAMGPGSFDALVNAMTRDAAMIVWLDGRENTAGAPNENFARELFELFTLGHFAHQHGAHAATQPYTEADVREAARALTGWVIDPHTYQGVFVPRRHDGGNKTVLGYTGALALDDIVSIAVGNEACAPHVVARLWSRIGRPAPPDDAVVQELAQLFARDHDVTALLRSMFLHPEFRTAATRTALVKMPVEWVVGTLRALRVDASANALTTLVALNQVPFFPPDVSGWPANGAWLSTSSAQVRLEFAMSVANRADLRPITSTPVRERPAAAARLLGVEKWSDTTDATLVDAAADPKLLVTLALVAPETALA
jgi:uncharacterized protein (DUF1800 family)